MVAATARRHACSTCACPDGDGFWALRGVRREGAEHASSLLSMHDDPAARQPGARRQRRAALAATSSSPIRPGELASAIRHTVDGTVFTERRRTLTHFALGLAGPAHSG